MTFLYKDLPPPKAGPPTSRLPTTNVESVDKQTIPVASNPEAATHNLPRGLAGGLLRPNLENTCAVEGPKIEMVGIPSQLQRKRPTAADTTPSGENKRSDRTKVSSSMTTPSTLTVNPVTTFPANTPSSSLTTSIFFAKDPLLDYDPLVPNNYFDLQHNNKPSRKKESGSNSAFAPSRSTLASNPDTSVDRQDMMASSSQAVDTSETGEEAFLRRAMLKFE